MKLNKRQKKILLFALISNYAIYLCMHLFFYSTYESQLDIMMQSALYGVSGKASAYILYSNVILGWILKALTSVMPSLNWYYMYLSLSVILSLSLISYILVKRADNKIGRTIAFVISCFLGYQGYVLPGAMKTAGVLAVSLLFLFADSYEMSAYKKKMRVFVMFTLAVLGSMTQLSAFLLTFLIGSVCLLCYYVIVYSEKEDDIKGAKVFICKKPKDVKRVMALVGGMLAVIVLLYVVDICSYRLSGREMAATYRGTMCRIYGYGLSKYDDNMQTCYGIDEGGYNAVKTGNFAFQNEATLDALRDLAMKSNNISVAKLDQYFKSVPIGLFKYGIFYLFIIMEFMVFYSPTKRKKELVWTEIALLVIITLLEYIFNAWGYNWTAVNTVSVIILPLMLALKDAREAEYQYLWVYLAVFSVILYSKFSAGMVSSVAEDDMQEKFASVDTNKCNMTDLNAYLKRFSSQHYYVPWLLSNGSIRITNGAYYLMDGYADKLLNGIDDGITYEWMYNPYNLDMWAVLLD